MKTQVQIETITAKQAATMLLNLHPRQRGTRESWVGKLAVEMTAGEFLLSPDAIVIINGMIANGQHRLRALVASGTSGKFIVLRTDDERIFGITDCGIKRTVADVIHVKNANVAQGANTWIMANDAGTITLTQAGSNLLQRSEQLKFFAENQNKIQEAVQFVLRYYREHKFLAPSMAAALVFLINRKTKTTQGEEFIELVYTGEGEPSSARDMRERLIKNKIAVAKLPNPYLFGMMIKSWKAWSNGERPGVLRIQEAEEFPQI